MTQIEGVFSVLKIRRILQQVIYSRDYADNLGRIEVVVSRMNSRIVFRGITLLWIGVLSISLVYVTPVSAQTGVFQGRYDISMDLEGISLQGEFDIYQYNSTDFLETYFGNYSPYYVTHRSDYRLESSSSGYIDVSNQYTYSNAAGKIFISETTYALRLDGYQQVTYWAWYEYGNFVTITNNVSLYEETYTERYYEDGIFQESVEYHEYTFLEMENESMYIEEVTVDAGVYDCFVLDYYLFEGIDTNITDPEDYDNYYQGGSLTWVDTEEGHLVQQWQYDENDEIIGEITLIEAPSTTDPSATPVTLGGLDTTLIIVGGGAGAIVIVAAVLLRSRRSSEIVYPGSGYEW